MLYTTHIIIYKIQKYKINKTIIIANHSQLSSFLSSLPETILMRSQEGLCYTAYDFGVAIKISFRRGLQGCTTITGSPLAVFRAPTCGNLYNRRYAVNRYMFRIPYQGLQYKVLLHQSNCGVQTDPALSKADYIRVVRIIKFKTPSYKETRETYYVQLEDYLILNSENSTADHLFVHNAFELSIEMFTTQAACRIRVYFERINNLAILHLPVLQTHFKDLNDLLKVSGYLRGFCTLKSIFLVPFFFHNLNFKYVHKHT